MLARYPESFVNLPSAVHAGPRFRPGQIFATPAALEVIANARVSILYLLTRHVRGDWGDICDEDRQQNELSVNAGLRLLSCYRLPDGGAVWIITEWDRSATTILLPDEY